MRVRVATFVEDGWALKGALCGINLHLNLDRHLLPQSREAEVEGVEGVG